ncbi:MAG: hypothetical protein U0175_05330 [Caldilineaceae bacterium]
MTSIEQELKQVELILIKLQSEPTFQAPLLSIGYSMEQLQQGLMLYERARTLIGERSEAQKAKLNATQDFRQIRYKAQRRYNLDLSLAKMALGDLCDWRALLKTNGSQHQAADNWQREAEIFYNYLQSDATLLELLEPYGLTSERLAASLNALQKVDEARSTHVQHHSEANYSTHERDAALKCLRNWLALFKISLCLACDNNPDLLASLGVEPRGQKARSQV